MIPLIARGLITAFRTPLGRRAVRAVAKKARPVAKKAKLRIVDTTKRGYKAAGRVLNEATHPWR